MHVDVNLGVIFVYLLSLPVAHVSNAPRRRSVVMADNARIQDETTESFTLFFNVLGIYSTVTRYLGSMSHLKDY